MFMPVLGAGIMLETAAAMPVVAACCRIPQEALHASTVSARQLCFEFRDVKHEGTWAFTALKTGGAASVSRMHMSQGAA